MSWHVIEQFPLYVICIKAATDTSAAALFLSQVQYYLIHSVSNVF